jgi:dolichol kinase
VLSQPEYVHVVINHLPLIGLPVAMLALAVALVMRNRAAILLGLALVALLALSAWPVSEYGEAGFDRVLSMSDDDGQAFLKEHQRLADRWVFLYYLTACTAAAGFALSWKWPRTLTPMAVAALALGAASLVAGFFIARAGGEIRHREFRTGPPPTRQAVA